MSPRADPLVRRGCGIFNSKYTMAIGLGSFYGDTNGGQASSFIHNHGHLSGETVVHMPSRRLTLRL